MDTSMDNADNNDKDICPSVDKYYVVVNNTIIRETILTDANAHAHSVSDDYFDIDIDNDILEPEDYLVLNDTRKRKTINQSNLNDFKKKYYYKKCIEDGCNKIPYFNIETETKGLYCVSHKKANMVNVISKKCIEDGCNIIPSFNIETETKGLYCGLHKKANMIDVRSKKCIEDGCKTQASFNIETESKGLYCALHKKANMVNIKSKKCIEDGCNRHPSFNIETETKRLYCRLHKKANMVDVISKNKLK